LALPEAVFGLFAASPPPLPSSTPTLLETPPKPDPNHQHPDTRYTA